MSIGHSPGHAPHAPDMRKSLQDVTKEEREDAQRRIEGSLAPESGSLQTGIASMK